MPQSTYLGTNIHDMIPSNHCGKSIPFLFNTFKLLLAFLPLTSLSDLSAVLGQSRPTDKGRHIGRRLKNIPFQPVFKWDWSSEDELAAVYPPPSTLSAEQAQAFSYGIRRRANRGAMWLTLTPGILEELRLVMLQIDWTSLDCDVDWMSITDGRYDH